MKKKTSKRHFLAEIGYLHGHCLFCILKNCFVYSDDDKPEMAMPKQIDVKVTKPQNKNGHGRTRKCPIAGI